MPEVKFDFDPQQIANAATPEPQPNPSDDKGDGGSTPDGQDGNPANTDPIQPDDKNKPDAVEPDKTKKDDPKDVDAPGTTPEPETDLDDDKLLKALQKKGFKGQSVEDFFKEPSKEPKSAPKSYDEETQKFLDFQERTGRGINDYQSLNKDFSKMGPVEVAKDRIRRESEGADLSEQDVNYLLESELGFDPNDEDITDQEKAKFKKYWGSHLNTLKKDQQKYNEPVEGYEPKKGAEPSQPDGGKKVKLSSGVEVDADSYDRDRQKYLTERDAALQQVGEDEFKMSYDSKDGKKESSFNYSYTDEDLQSMKSITDDVPSIMSSYQKENGEFDHTSFNKDLLWTKPEFRNKAISALLSRARNEVISETTAQRKNVNFDSPNDPPKHKKDGYSEPGNQNQSSGPKVKFNFPSN